MLQRLLPFFSLVALFIGLAVASPYFLTGTNLSSVARQTAVINIMALGMTMVIIAGASISRSAPLRPFSGSSAQVHRVGRADPGRPADRLGLRAPSGDW